MVHRYATITKPHPEVFQSIFFSSGSAEAQLVVARFAFASALFDVLKCHFVAIRSPGVGKNSIGWRLPMDFLEAELAITLMSQQMHIETAVEAGLLSCR